jgi:hypothetical protein|nr:MAG TPA: hypothetical protein [Caudoviricetes sp.]
MVVELFNTRIGIFMAKSDNNFCVKVDTDIALTDL